ncbi:MAG: hypothetical protein JST26_01025 [Bacteroidetes bacterium]|nr:hypothetical protein [Bacteroidota bacterium]
MLKKITRFSTFIFNLKTKNMKQISILLLALFTVFLISCAGSDTYRGAWKAMDADGAKYDLVFDAKSLIIKDSTGNSSTIGYTQNSVHIENSVETYGIQLSDGRTYQINFPIAHDESLGLIKDGNGVPMYTISRKAYTTYDEAFRLK